MTSLISSTDYDGQGSAIFRTIMSRQYNTHNNGDCGTGKTTTTIAEMALDVRLNPDHYWIIAVPLHKLIEGDNNILEECLKNGLDAVHIWGKNHYTANFTVQRCYIDGCKGCSMNNAEEGVTCPFLNQRFEAQVCIIPYELINTIRRHASHHWTGIIVEEDPSRYWFKEMEITDLMRHVEISNPQMVDYWGGKYKFWQTVTFYDFDVVDHDTYKLQMLIKYNINFKVHEWKGRYTLICNKERLLPRYFKKIIFNCATTPSAFRDTMFDMDGWLNIGIHKEFANPIISVGYNWGKENTNKRVAQFKDILSFLTANGLKTLVVTKLEVEDELKGLDVDVVHYGSSRGFNNNSKDYDIVLVYGAFHWNPLGRLKYMQLGIMEDVISNLENAEIIQAVNRFRPILRPDVPIILMTQSVAIYEKETWTTLPDKAFDYYAKYPVTNEMDILDRDEDYTIITYYGYRTLVEWIQRWVFKSLSRNQLIVQCRVEGKSIKQTAGRCGVSISTVKRVYKEVLDKYGKELGRYQKRMFEMII